jgi:hypothetical protein
VGGKLWRPNCTDRGHVELPDRRRGSLPEIQSAETSIRFLLKITLPYRTQYRLTIRCDGDGAIYASIQSIDDK